jgi:hypothetical protein
MMRLSSDFRIGALLARKKGDREGAIQDFTLSIHLDPTSAQAFTNRAAQRAIG